MNSVCRKSRPQRNGPTFSASRLPMQTDPREEWMMCGAGRSHGHRRCLCALSWPCGKRVNRLDGKAWHLWDSETVSSPQLGNSSKLGFLPPLHKAVLVVYRCGLQVGLLKCLNSRKFLPCDRSGHVSGDALQHNSTSHPVLKGLLYERHYSFFSINQKTSFFTCCSQLGFLLTVLGHLFL